MELHKLTSLLTLFVTVVTTKGTTKRHLQYLIYNYKCLTQSIKSITQSIKSITQYNILSYTLYLQLLYSLNIINLYI